MEYQIISANAESGQIEVLYKENGLTLAIYAIDVPVVDGAFLTKVELDAEIQHRAPTWLSQRKQEIQGATGFSEIAELVVVPVVEAQTEFVTERANQVMWEQIDYENKLSAALFKLGVISTDINALPIAVL
jgi:hypothetical protein